MRCRIFPYQSADGPANMAIDEALIDAVAADPTVALLRTYGWTEPTLSLGYFQPIALAEADPRWQGVPVVRRPTGGGAIWHHHELTYALVLPTAHPLARPRAALYHCVHSAIALLLRSHGVEAESRGPVASSPSDPRPFLCFADRDPEDLVCQGSKIAGSAQRRRSGAILQHGSMLLRQSPRTTELPGVSDLSPASADPRFWSERIVTDLPLALGLVPVIEDFPVALCQRARDLRDEVYRNHAWNRRR